jgi:aminoglycoside phosphotransferase (APT) family kinase protein
LAGWVEAALGGTLTRWDPLVSGNSRTAFLADLDRGSDSLELVVRAEHGLGPFAGTELTLAREAGVYGELGGSAVRIPRLHGFDESLQAMAIERVGGGPDWDPDVLGPYLAEIARLHSIDVSALKLPGFARTAGADLELWARIAAEKIAPRSAFVDFAIAFLREAFPGEPDRLVLCHGDAGAGNFLHDGAEITGLLDWEFAHVGDPLDDLAWIAVRAILYGHDLPGLGVEATRCYASRASVELDERRYRYWVAVVILRNLITCHASISNPVRGRDRLVHHMLVPPLNRMLVGALAWIAGVELEPAEPPVALHGLPGADLLMELGASATDLAQALAGAETEPAARRLAFLLRQIAQTWPLAPDIALRNAAEGPPATDARARIGQLARSADRELALLPRAERMARVAIPPLVV